MNYWERWIGDWKRKTAHLSAEAKGIYGELLDHEYATQKPLPLDHEAIYRICGARTTAECKTADKVIAEFYKKTNEGYINPRAQAEIAKRAAYVQAQSERANLRWKDHVNKETGEAPAPQRKKKLNGADTTETWAAYLAAYQKRYGAEPVRNAKVNSQLTQLVKRLGADDAPQVAAFFLTHSNSFYVSKGHAVGILLSDAEKLRTEWATGRRVTQTEARQKDRTQGIANAFAPLIEEARRKENDKIA